MKKIVVLILALAIILTLAACGGNTDAPSNLTASAPPTSAGTSDATDTPTANMGDGTGTYEGETDENGKFTGYGVWIYHNFRYEGYFENGVPNGDGTLYQHTPYEWDNTITGQWVDGYAEGDISYYIFYRDRNEGFTFNFSVTKGQSDAEVAAVEDSEYLMDMQYDVWGVPPFADVQTDPSLAPPEGSGQSDGTTTTPSTPTPSTDVQDIPDNGTPPTVEPPLESHAGDKGYFYAVTDDYIVWVEEVDGYQQYNIISFDSDGEFARFDHEDLSDIYLLQKNVFESEAAAADFVSNNQDYYIQIENVAYLIYYAPEVRFGNKEATIGFLDAYDRYISKP